MTTTTTMIDLAQTERIGELHSEVRRTRNPDFHDRLVGEEETLKGLLAKLRSE
ncbi:MAG: hypothetical protein ACYTGC_15725 [Planctomycetota bacterium]|jgi:hypothetical protein